MNGNNRNPEVKTSAHGKSPSRKVAAALAWLSVAGLCALAVAPTPASASTYDFVGRWMNFEHDSSGITGILVTQSRSGLNIKVYGLCRGQPICDWNVAQANLYSSRSSNWERANWGEGDWGGFNWGGGNWSRDTSVVTASFDVGYARKFIVLRRGSSNELRVEIFTDSRDRYGRGGYVTQSRLQRWGRPSGGPGYPDRGLDRQYPDDRDN